jgi:hypothetical protein
LPSLNHFTTPVSVVAIINSFQMMRGTCQRNAEAPRNSPRKKSTNFGMMPTYQ